MELRSIKPYCFDELSNCLLGGVVAITCMVQLKPLIALDENLHRVIIGVLIVSVKEYQSETYIGYIVRVNMDKISESENDDNIRMRCANREIYSFKAVVDSYNGMA